MIVVFGKPVRISPKKLTVAVLLLAVVSGYLLVLVHVEQVHGSASSTDGCIVCSWAKNLGTIGTSVPGIVLVSPAGRVAPPSLLVWRPFCYRLPLSARSPPTRAVI